MFESASGCPYQGLFAFVSKRRSSPTKPKMRPGGATDSTVFHETSSLAGVSGSSKEVFVVGSSSMIGEEEEVGGGVLAVLERDELLVAERLVLPVGRVARVVDEVGVPTHGGGGICGTNSSPSSVFWSSSLIT